MEFDVKRPVWSVLQLGINLFQTLQDVGEWLFSSNSALGGSAPIEFIFGVGLIVILSIAIVKWIL